MATFEVQVEALTSLAITDASTPTQDELSQFLKDGVVDVTRRIIMISPQDAKNFSTVSSEQTSNGLDINGAQPLSVVRESGTNNDWRQCRQITPGLQSRVTDEDSLQFASKFNPAFTILDNGTIYVYPVPGADPDAFKVYYINNVPQDKGGAALIYSHSDIKYFADDKVYLVVLYAAIQCIEAKIASYAVDEEDTELVQAYHANLVILQSQYEKGFGGVNPQAQGGQR